MYNYDLWIISITKKNKKINKLSLFIAVNINVSEENPYKNKQQGFYLYQYIINHS